MPPPPHPLGLHRSLEPPGALPQLAWKLDSDPRARSNEIAIAVRALNIDSASFHDLSQRAASTGETVPAQIARIVGERGKMHNPATSSGGNCLGEIREIGPDHPAAGTFSPGDRVATLVSLSLTPLALDEVGPVVTGSERVAAKGTAILFARTLLARLPDDLPEALALAAFDVCGAPALLRRHAQGSKSVLVVGAGKAGLLCLAAAREVVGSGKLLAVDASEAAVERARGTGLADAVLRADARDPVALLSAVERANEGNRLDLVVNVANVPGTETASVLCARDDGTVLFFGMATSFQAAALGAEGVAHPGTLLIGNGYVPGHAEYALDLLRSHDRLRAAFTELVG
ncbi:MAG TPA: L-erythro-3,5-diaminohexanoate dehydrogenase [Thermoanaerobaculia bacterium]